MLRRHSQWLPAWAWLLLLAADLLYLCAGAAILIFSEIRAANNDSVPYFWQLVATELLKLGDDRISFAQLMMGYQSERASQALRRKICYAAAGAPVTMAGSERWWYHDSNRLGDWVRTKLAWSHFQRENLPLGMFVAGFCISAVLVFGLFEMRLCAMDRIELFLRQGEREAKQRPTAEPES